MSKQFTENVPKIPEYVNKVDMNHSYLNMQSASHQPSVTVSGYTPNLDVLSFSQVGSIYI